ncbi:hypothetical protein [Cupriavidus taiwanensis]|uniref:hypothetical protein n=1 Tax=Cupriavidus taiwanensis TaxID=164546 RepID=UPI000E1492F6|nr:hypothetical protein [Cupriavidus taiwanensis]SPA52984.1 conserved hypothetical protein [Cupriavidus taiwanensis]
MSKTNLRPYNITRNLDQDAWFLYQTTSFGFYELCATLCEEFANLYNGFITDHGLHRQARLDYWVSRYLQHADNIRRGVKFIQDGGDYMPMVDFLNSPTTDYRGLIEQPLGWMNEEQSKQWKTSHEKLSAACGTGHVTLNNLRPGGLEWLRRDAAETDSPFLDRDDSHVGDMAQSIKFMEKHGILNSLETYPRHTINDDFAVFPGQTCPRTGVWVPSQWIEGASNFSLAFCVEGLSMQPAYQIIGLDMWHLDDEDGGTLEPDWELEGDPVTKATNTTWHFVENGSMDQKSPIGEYRLRCEGGQPCPKSGYWITPPKSLSRRYFKRGDTMPEVASDYGTTIWQWDINQSDPKL